MKTIIDTFAGIGGFSYAFDQVFYEEKNEHIFVENDPFCQAVLRKHWPKAEIHGDIREFVADTERKRPHSKKNEQELGKERSSQFRTEQPRPYGETFILTGGFPCQPFSQAGRRKGTADDRYLWPPMFEAIALFRPEWVIAENVAGLAYWNDGMVLETVCADLESENYEVQPFVIPACAVGAPHRRDRVWIVANCTSERYRKREQENNRPTKTKTGNRLTEENETATQKPISSRTRGRNDTSQRPPVENQRSKIQTARPDWTRNWQEVAFATCNGGVDDGPPRRMDGTTISPARHRRERLIACGNAIVPAVAIELMKAIKETD